MTVIMVCKFAGYNGLMAIISYFLTQVNYLEIASGLRKRSRNIQGLQGVYTDAKKKKKRIKEVFKSKHISFLERGRTYFVERDALGYLYIISHRKSR